MSSRFNNCHAYANSSNKKYLTGLKYYFETIHKVHKPKLEYFILVDMLSIEFVLIFNFVYVNVAIDYTSVSCIDVILLLY